MHHFLNLQRTLVFKCILVDVVTDLQGGSIKAPSCVYVCVCVCVCVWRKPPLCCSGQGAGGCIGRLSHWYCREFFLGLWSLNEQLIFFRRGQGFERNICEVLVPKGEKMAAAATQPLCAYQVKVLIKVLLVWTPLFKNINLQYANLF